MEVIAKLNHLRISPRKVRLVANLIRGLSVVDAESQLKFLVKKSALPIEKLLQSAVANAVNNNHLIKENLYISRITVYAGQTLKRWRPRAMGRAAAIMKRTSCINLVLDEIQPIKQKQQKTQDKIMNVDKIDKKEEVLVESGEKKKTKDKASVKSYTNQMDKKSLKHQQVGQAKKIFRRKSI